jgi:hypothetical protein
MLLRIRIRRVQLAGLAKKCERRIVVAQVVPIDELPHAEDVLVGQQVGGAWPLQPGLLGGGEVGLQAAGDLLRDVALNREDILQWAVVTLGPEVRVRVRVDQLRGSAPARLRVARYLPAHV